MIKNIFIFLSLIIVLTTCSKQRGADVYIRHFLKTDFLLKVSLYNEEGKLLDTRLIPMNHSTIIDFSDFSSHFNCDFKKLAIIAELLNVPDGKILDKKIGLWPGNTGTSCSASSNRICIEIAIKKIKIGLFFLMKESYNTTFAHHTANVGNLDSHLSSMKVNKSVTKNSKF